MKREKLTPRQHEVLVVIVTHFRDYGSAPTVREIGAELGIVSPNGVVGNVKAIVAKGWLRWGRNGKTRALVVPELIDAVAAAAKKYLEKLK